MDSCSGLGFWQLERLKWKQEIVDTIENGLHSDPIEMPDNLSDLLGLVYQRVKLRGVFLHEHSMLVGPRVQLRNMVTTRGEPGATGHHLVVPFQLTSSGKRILLNRGFVPDGERELALAANSMMQGEVEVNAIVRGGASPKAPYVPENVPAANQWFWIDVDCMAVRAAAEPFLLDACADATPLNGVPLGGQTIITIRNQHLEYAITWFGLGFCTFLMWLTM